MRDERSHPSWWQLYLIGLGMIGLLMLGASVPLSQGGHEAAALGTLLLTFGLVALWLRANTRALLQVSQQLLAHTPRPQLTREAADTDDQGVLVSWRQLLEQEPEPQTEGAAAHRELND